jgi:hypothetical protein
MEFAMNTRRILAIAAPGLAVSLVVARTRGMAAAAEPTPHADFLFVQTSKDMHFEKTTSTLTSDGVRSVTMFFSDRPERIAGNMRTADFVPFWSGGRDSFLSDPPNADFSILEGSTLHQTVVVLRDPVPQGDGLDYGVKVVSGDIPAKGTDVSAFIDVIGMPLTLLSFAGTRRLA